jgi:Uri superfamily endonuclease
MNVSLLKGTYILVLRLNCARSIQVGKLGKFEFQPGYYLYVGSAFGPGGLAGRLKHHVKTSPRPHWHIDYLRRKAVVEQVWYSEDEIPREHQWANRLQTVAGVVIPVPGFGASDCTCRSHLFHFSRLPSIQLFERVRWLLGKELKP